MMLKSILFNEIYSHIVQLNWVTSLETVMMGVVGPVLIVRKTLILFARYTSS